MIRVIVKRLFFLFVLLILSFNISHAQGFYNVYSPNGVDVWAVGNGGKVFRSYDGGNTWASFTLGSLALRSIAVRDTNVWIVGDRGLLYKNSGGQAWTVDTIAAVRLRAITMLSGTIGCVVGDSGTILKTTNAGQTWLSVTSPSANNLRTIVFRDSLRGWIVGDDGTIMKSSDAGSTWNAVQGLGILKNLHSVALRGDTVIVTGADATAARSYDGGVTWTSMSFNIESKSDVNKGIILSSGEVMFCGGGGFIRKTADGGRSFTFQKNPMLASLYDMYFYDDQRGWACSERTDAIVRTTNGGATWLLTAGTTVNYSWTQKLATGATVRGNTFAINAFDKKTIYVVLGTGVYISRNIGETWTQIATIPGGTETNSFYVSPLDTNLFVAAFGATDVITRSTNRGATWTTTLTRAFTEYGMPLEMDPNESRTLYFGPEDGYLYCSRDFGATWDTLSRPMFRSPCDFVVVYEKPNIMYCGDGVTGSGNGQIFRSDDYGRSWNLIVTVSGSEVPTIGSSWLDDSLAFATAWGAGGVRRTIDGGLSWQQIQTTGATWGVDIAKDDPNVAMYGVYSGSTSYLTTDAGQTWITTSLTGSNYAFLCYDRSTILAQQSGGVYKYNITYSVPVTNQQVISIIQPASGTIWQYNTIQNITWTSANITNVKIEYKTSPASSWQIIVASTPATTGSYAWRIPYTPTTQARVRISDASDGIPVDSSALFTITAPSIAIMPTSLNFGEVAVGMSGVDTLRITNNGTATLVIGSVTTDSAFFTPGRTSFSIPPGSSDTLTVVFAPSQVRAYHDTLRIINNTPDSLWRIPLSGIGTTPVGITHESTRPTRYLLEQNYPNPFNPATVIIFELPRDSYVTLRVYNILGQEIKTLVDGYYPAGRHGVQFDASGLPSGLYLYRISASESSLKSGFVDTKQMILIK